MIFIVSIIINYDTVIINHVISVCKFAFQNYSDVGNLLTGTIIVEWGMIGYYHTFVKQNVFPKTLELPQNKIKFKIQ